MVVYAKDHSPHTYKVFKYVPNEPGEIIITRGGNTGITHINNNKSAPQTSITQPEASAPTLIRVAGLNTQQQELMPKMIDEHIVENKLCLMEYRTGKTDRNGERKKKDKRTDNFILRRKSVTHSRKKGDPQQPQKHTTTRAQTNKDREDENEDEEGFIVVSHKKVARRTPPTQERPTAPQTSCCATPQRATAVNPRVISSTSDD
jgi:hypothetical protein